MQAISVDRNEDKGGTAPQGCQGLQRGKEPGKFRSCVPFVLMTGPGAPPLWAEHLHPGSHQRALTARTTSQGQSLMTNSIWGKHSHLPPPRRQLLCSVQRCSQDAPWSGGKCYHCICCFPGNTSWPMVSPGPAETVTEEELIILRSPNWQMPSHLQSNQGLMECEK